LGGQTFRKRGGQFFRNPHQRGSHTQVYRDAALDSIGPAVEAIVASDESFFELWRNRLRPVFRALHQASKQVDEDNPVNFGCNFNFRY
ncbi:MAG: hypothetical protein AAB224_00005, partial [Gemmatimonadota bacterium]